MALSQLKTNKIKPLVPSLIWEPMLLYIESINMYWYVLHVYGILKHTQKDGQRYTLEILIES